MPRKWDERIDQARVMYLEGRKLVQTESCFASRELTAQSYEECGIERYRYLAMLASLVPFYHSKCHRREIP